MKQSNMIHIIAVLVLFIGLSFTTVAQVDNRNFGDAEERIIYNKANGLDRYDGILIEYIFQITLNGSYTESELKKTSSNLFTNYISSTTYKEEHLEYFAVITKGNIENHLKVQDFEREFDFEIYSINRRYHLIISHD